MKYQNQLVVDRYEIAEILYKLFLDIKHNDENYASVKIIDFIKAPTNTGGPPETLSFAKNPTRGTSAPSSPAKSRESLLQRVQSLTGAARDQGKSNSLYFQKQIPQIINNFILVLIINLFFYLVRSTIADSVQQAFNKDRCFTLLVLDDQNTDWSKYFRGKRLHGDYDIRVEQAEFRELSVTASGESGPVVGLASFRTGAKVNRIFYYG